ncbi:DNA-binding response regulator [Salipaludibacillus neizhouensis]|uniref:DNA-binding response regulator n=1 Tax=Salipaludibacillus neizhouensis TaxID=885475 RepID=A0A3A9K453_9BACI|nr:response regulator [Salipaludibacillus neizhouensis]RKL67119.1 DNA-binding response regulator [Salipaludibacillus neizhouensis]
MYKVLVVDDEPTVREGMRAIIPWEDYGFEITAVANDGYTALDKYRELSPDVIISDIRMPGMDGLELLKNLHEIDHTIQCLILSGYADFDYAKKAIQSNAAGYLLKPIDEEELVDYLNKVKKELEKQQKVTQLTVIDAERKRDSFILSMLLKKERASSEVIFEAKQFDLEWDKYEILLIRLEEMNEHDSTIITIKSKIQKIIKTNHKGIVFSNEPYVAVLMESKLNNKKERLLLFGEIKDMLNSIHVSFTVASGKPVTDISEINVSYNMATQLIHNKFFFPKDELLSEGKEVIKRQNNKCVDMDESIDKLYFALDIGIEDSIETIISEIAYLAEEIYSEDEVKRSYVYVLTTALNKLLISKPEKAAYISSVLEKVLEVYQQKSMIDLQSFVSALVVSVYNKMEYDANTDDQLKRLLVLIDSRYNENLKLDKLADLLNYNSAYLGKLFKKYTGEYFNTYLDKVRIMNAKRLLIEGKKVYQVAEIIGYNNVDYFHSKFKKYVGTSPSAYRRNKQAKIE